MNKDILKVARILEHHYQANKASIDRRNARIEKEIQESKALAKECEKQADALFDHISEGLDKDQKAIFALYSILAPAPYMRSYQIFRARALFRAHIKKAKELLTAGKKSSKRAQRAYPRKG